MIPLFNPRRCKPALFATVNSMARRRFGPGVAVEEFEDRLSELYDIRYVAATTSGTMALFLAIHALRANGNMIPESTVYYPAYGFIAGAEQAVLCGHGIKLIDVDTNTLQITRQTLAQETWFRYPAFIFIEHNGIPTDAGRLLMEMLSGRRVPVIMDLACSIANHSKRGPADFYTWSFSSPKLVQTGQGGAIGTNDPDLYRHVKDLQDHGGRLWRVLRTHEKLGFNLRFNDILASYGLAQLSQIKWIKEQNREIWSTYNAAFGKPLPFKCGWCYSFWSKQPRSLINKLQSVGIEAAQLYPLVSSNPGLRPHVREIVGYPNAAMAAEHLVYFPSWIGLKAKEVKFIAEQVLKAEGL